MVKMSRIIDILEEIAPKQWAESWDNCGLLVGDMNRNVNKIMVALELNHEVMADAVAHAADLIVTHHPLYLKPLTTVRTDQFPGSLIQSLIQSETALYAMHTNYDRSPNGINSFLSDTIGMVNSKPLEKAKEPLYKLVVYVPEGHEGLVLSALAAAGAGKIGRYSHCSFQVEGTGTFLPEEGTDPFIGEVGSLEHACEVRLETIIPSAYRARAISAMLKVHPYEEVAFDLYPLVAPVGMEGLGRIGNLNPSIPWPEFRSRIKQIFHKDWTVMGGASPPEHVERVAILAGSGASYLERAASDGAQVYMTGDIKYHDYRRGEELNLTLIDVGHYNSEVLGVFHISQMIEHAVNEDQLELQVISSTVLNDPCRLMEF
jgi:dinuclear metal center YbgI/SA1388 family protein